MYFHITTLIPANRLECHSSLINWKSEMVWRSTILLLWLTRRWWWNGWSGRLVRSCIHGWYVSIFHRWLKGNDTILIKAFLVRRINRVFSWNEMVYMPFCHWEDNEPLCWATVYRIHISSGRRFWTITDWPISNCRVLACWSWWDFCLAHLSHVYMLL